MTQAPNHIDRAVALIVSLRRGSMDDNQFKATVTHNLTNLTATVREEDNKRIQEIIAPYRERAGVGTTLADLIDALTPEPQITNTEDGPLPR